MEIVEVEGEKDLTCFSIILQKEAEFREIKLNEYRNIEKYERKHDIGSLYNYLKIPNERKAKLLRKNDNLLLIFEGGGKPRIYKLLSNVLFHINNRYKSFTSFNRASLIIDLNADKINGILYEIIKELHKRLETTILSKDELYAEIEVKKDNRRYSVDIILIKPNLDVILKDVSISTDKISELLNNSNKYQSLMVQLTYSSGLEKFLNRIKNKIKQG